MATPDTLGGTSLAVWFKADAITGFADGDALTSWVDSSVNVNTLGPGYGTAPKYRATGGPNGLPCVDHTVAAGSLGKIGVSPLPTGDLTYFMVLSSASTAIQNLMNANFQTNGNNSAELRLETGHKITLLKSAVAGIKTSTAALTPNTWTLVLVTFTSVGSIIHFDIGGTIEDYSLGTTRTFTDADRLSYGSYQNGATLFNGKMAEIGLYNSVLSSGDLASLKAYLTAKYFTAPQGALRRATIVASQAAQRASRW